MGTHHRIGGPHSHVGEHRIVAVTLTGTSPGTRGASTPEGNRDQRNRPSARTIQRRTLRVQYHGAASVVLRCPAKLAHVTRAVYDRRIVTKHMIPFFLTRGRYKDLVKQWPTEAAKFREAAMKAMEADAIAKYGEANSPAKSSWMNKERSKIGGIERDIPVRAR